MTYYVASLQDRFGSWEMAGGVMGVLRIQDRSALEEVTEASRGGAKMFVSGERPVRVAAACRSASRLEVRGRAGRRSHR